MRATPDSAATRDVKILASAAPDASWNRMCGQRQLDRLRGTAEGLIVVRMRGRACNG